MEKYHKNLSEDQKKTKNRTKKIVPLFNCVEELEEYGLVCKFGEWGPILKSGIVRTILNFAIKEKFGKQTFLKFLNPEYIKKFLYFENR